MANKLMLNSIPSSVFSGTPADFGGSQKRADIVTCGRYLMRERAGMDSNPIRVSSLRSDKGDSYTPRMDAEEYSVRNEKLQSSLLLYCAEVACRQTDAEAPQTMEDFRKYQRKFMSDRTFLKVLAGVMEEIVTPVLPATFSEAVSLTAEMENVPVGETKEIVVSSNDVFLFNDSAYGSQRSVPSNYLYDQPITLNPRPRTAKVTVKWYQLVANGADIGRFLNALSAGMYSKIMALWNNAMTTMAANTAIVPSNLAITYNTGNFIALANRLAAVNNVGIRNLICFGNAVACSKILPSTVTNAASVSLDAALTTMLGAEYIRAGYLGENMGVRIMPVNDAIIPGTQNTTVSTILSDSTVYMMAAPGIGHKPLYIGYEDGTPITLTLDPSETADNTIDVSVTMSLDVVAVAATKIGKITC